MQLGVFSEDAIVVSRTDHIWVLFKLLFRRNELRADVGRPEVRRCRPLAAKPCLQLTGVEHLNELLWCSVAREHDFQLGFWVDEYLDSVIKEPLAPADMSVEGAKEEVHQVVLADVTEGQDLLAWEGYHRHVIEVANGDPLLDLSRHEHRLPHVLEEKLEEIVEDVRSDHFRFLLGHASHDCAIHDEARSVEFVTAVQVETAGLQ